MYLYHNVIDVTGWECDAVNTTLLNAVKLLIVQTYPDVCYFNRSCVVHFRV